MYRTESGGNQIDASFQWSPPRREYRTHLIPPAMNVVTHVKCGLSGRHTETQLPGLPLGASHIGTIHPTYINIPNSQEESRCPAQVVQALQANLFSSPEWSEPF